MSFNYCSSLACERKLSAPFVLCWVQSQLEVRAKKINDLEQKIEQQKKEIASLQQTPGNTAIARIKARVYDLECEVQDLKKEAVEREEQLRTERERVGESNREERFEDLTARRKEDVATIDKQQKEIETLRVNVLRKLSFISVLFREFRFSSPAFMFMETFQLRRTSRR